MSVSPPLSPEPSNSLSDEEKFVREIWSAFVAIVIYQHNPSYGIAVMKAITTQQYANPAQRLVASRSETAIREWVRVWEESWKGMPPEWAHMKNLLGSGLDVIIDAHPSVKQQNWSLYRSTVIPADYRQPPVGLVSSLTTAYTWKNLVYWASLPVRIRMEVVQVGPVSLPDIDRVTQEITQKLISEIVFLSRSLPIWKGWIP